MKSEWAVGSPSGTITQMTDSGWITAETFLDWGREFVKFVPKDDLPHLLLLDGHGSHIYNTDFLDYMSSNNIHVMFFPSHTTHVLQPADISLFKSLKSHWTTHGLQFNRMHGGRKPGRSDFFTIFSSAWAQAATVENAQSGFRAAGLFPVEFSAIKNRVFLPSRTTERPLMRLQLVLHLHVTLLSLTFLLMHVCLLYQMTRNHQLTTNQQLMTSLKLPTSPTGLKNCCQFLCEQDQTAPAKEGNHRRLF